MKRSRVSIFAGFVVGGWLLAAAEAIRVPAPAGRPAVMAFAGALGSVPAALMAAVALALVWALPRLPSAPRWRDLYDRTTTTDPDADRAPVIASSALMLSALVVLGVLAVLVPPLFDKLFSLQVRPLAVELAGVIAIGLLLMAAVAVILLSSWLRTPLRWLDRRWPLPHPRPLWARFLLFVVLPLFAGLYPFLSRHGSMLSWLRDGSILLLLLCLGTLGALLLGRLRGVWQRRVSLTLALAALLGLVAVTALSARLPQTTAAAERGMTASLGARLLRFVTDVDRDGASALLGGGDCAGFDSARGPGAAEIYGNGIDEDCDGSDNEAPNAQLEAVARYSGALAPNQVLPYNIVWVVMETVRADHLPSYGYNKPTMPYFAELAEESLLFEHAYSQASATLFSIPSMMTGVTPGAMTWTTTKLQPQPIDSELLLAERLQGHGYKTGAVVENYMRSQFPGMLQGYDQVLVGEPDRSGRYNRPRRNLFANAQAADFIARIGPNDRFFLWQYYVDPHGPYTRHPDIDNSQFSKDDPGNYDSELAWTDQALRSFIEMLRSRRALWARTIVIVTADHGEEFYEHGTHSHATSCHEESLHVPLLIRIPGIKPQRVSTRVALVDVIPTLLELTGLTDNDERLSGQSLLTPVLAPGKVSETRPLFCTIASITDKYGVFLRRAVRQGHYAFIADITKNQYELFDMAADPGERQDLAQSPDQRARVASMRALLNASLTGNLREHTRMRTNLKGGR